MQILWMPLNDCFLKWHSNREKRIQQCQLISCMSDVRKGLGSIFLLVQIVLDDRSRRMMEYFYM